MSDSTPPSERRRAMRHLACVPAHIKQIDTSDKTALISDLSVSGAHLLVRGGMREGDQVRLELFIALDMKQSRTAVGRVVRVEALDRARRGIWTHSLGIEFEWPLTLYAEEIDALRARTEG